MKQLSRSIPVLISILTALVMISGCKENTLINSKVSPANNAIGIYDTSLAVITHSYFDDTVSTSSHYSPIYEGLGTYTDPFFGDMTSSIYFNIIPTDFSQIDPSLIDSAVLVLPYSGFSYGDTLNTSATQTYQVFYMQDSLGFNTTYYSSSTKPVDLVHPLSDPTTVNVYHMKDSMGLFVLAQNQPGLRIKLNVANLKGPLANAVNTTTGTADFLTRFNGFCVQVADTRKKNATIPFFQLDGTSLYDEASLVVYTHTAAAPDTAVALPFYYDINYCSHFNAVTKSYSRFPVNALFHSTQANDPVIALQNNPGASLDIVIPGIKSLPAGIINKAELQLTLLPGYGNYVSTTTPGDSILFAPVSLYPTGVGTSTYPTGIGNQVLYNIADRYPIYSNSPFVIIDGTMHQFTKNGVNLNTFTVDIPREVMASIAAKNDTIHLHIGGTQDFYGAFHMVAGGGSYPDSLYRAKLFVVYSKLNK